MLYAYDWSREECEILGIELAYELNTEIDLDYPKMGGI
jgi:hypothetical protein